jgi:hypothetical protein
MKNIASALVKAQIAFGPALKESVNPAFRRDGKGGKYADLASCVESVISALNANGIFLFQTTSEHPDGIVCETSFLHESGERLDCGKLFFPAPKHDPQGFMSCLTYIRRASLMTATSQAPEDDDGNASVQKAPSKVNIIDHLAAIEASANSDELTKVYKIAHDACQGDQALIGQIIAAKKKRIEKAKKEQTNG